MRVNTFLFDANFYAYIHADSHGEFNAATHVQHERDACIYGAGDV